MLFGVGTHSKRRPWHCTLHFHTKVQVWGKSLSISLQSSKHPKEYPCFKKASDLACSKKKEKKRGKEKRERDKKRRKKERERKEKERKEEGKSEGEPWLYTLKQLMHTIIKNPAPLPFQAFAAPLRTIKPLQGVLFPHTRQEYHTPSLQQFQGIHPSCWW